jgi:two-component sensor histidine kinase
MAMAHVQSLLTDANWGLVQLKTLITSALTTMRTLASACAEPTISGPTVRMPPELVTPMTLIMVEWFTNSMKYGAASRSSGRIVVAWQIREGAVQLTWSEYGGPRIEFPGTPSLGTELVNSFVTRELKGRCRMQFPAEGARHTIEFPVPVIDRLTT